MMSVLDLDRGWLWLVWDGWWSYDQIMDLQVLPHVPPAPGSQGKTREVLRISLSGVARKPWNWRHKNGHRWKDGWADKKEAEDEREKLKQWGGPGADTSWSSVFPCYARGLTGFSFPMCKTIQCIIQIRKCLYLSIKPYEVEVWFIRSIWSSVNWSHLRITRPGQWAITGAVIQIKIGHHPVAHDHAFCPSYWLPAAPLSLNWGIKIKLMAGEENQLCWQIVSDIYFEH